MKGKMPMKYPNKDYIEHLCRKIAEHSLEVQQHLTEARRDRAEQQKQEQERARDRRPNIDLTL